MCGEGGLDAVVQTLQNIYRAICSAIESIRRIAHQTEEIVLQ